MSSLCGTYSGWNLHKRRKEEVCLPCQEAATIYMRTWRFRAGHYHDPTRCSECGSAFIVEHECGMSTESELFR